MTVAERHDRELLGASGAALDAKASEVVVCAVELFAFCSGGYADFNTTCKLKVKPCSLGRFCERRLGYNPSYNPAKWCGSTGFHDHGE